MQPVLKLSLLPSGHSHQVDHGSYKVLLTNVDGVVYAVESKCSHFGLPLKDAALSGHRLRCPFHHACFDVRDGRQLEAPGLDGLLTFTTEVKNGEIWVSDDPSPASKLSFAPASAPKENTHYDYAIVGGGIAAANAVEGIRETDETGSIVLLTRESLPPYDRTHVSKALLDGNKEVDDLPLRPADFYTEHGVDLRTNSIVSEVNVEQNTISILGGQFLTYGKVLLASGGTPRHLDVPGNSLGGVFLMRRAQDAEAVREKVTKGSNVVIIGAGFIGLEAAMSLGKQGGSITVVSPETTLFVKVFGEEVGRYIQQLHENEGVKFELGRRIKELHGEQNITAVELDDGRTLDAEVVLVGIGVEPETSYLVGLAADKDGGISVNNHLEAGMAKVYAAGDIARYPDREGAARIEHWKVAAQQGRVAGRNMAGNREAYTMIPFFWTNQQGVNLRYIGHGTDYDKIVYDGTPGEGPFLAFYTKGEHVQAVLGVKRDKDVAAIGELIFAGKMVDFDDLVGADWNSLL
ncbi:FAD-dependent oxidoreductase [Neolewinella persica]|uniref:FAD-dependent oxidoreductase n=1 Tax=Neolewinella persica TaxID=70998 RepID=UPI00038149D5|nr:FAD-dependent oxidoreductase [Neolewinella persica]